MARVNESSTWTYGPHGGLFFVRSTSPYVLTANTTMVGQYPVSSSTFIPSEILTIDQPSGDARGPLIGEIIGSAVGGFFLGVLAIWVFG